MGISIPYCLVYGRKLPRDFHGNALKVLKRYLFLSCLNMLRVSWSFMGMVRMIWAGLRENTLSMMFSELPEHVL